VSEAQGRFLVVRGGAIGDFILTLPVFGALREMFPKAHIELLGYPNVARLALEGGAVDAARSIDARPMASYFIRRGESDPGLRNYFGSFQVVISYLYDPDGFFQLNVSKCGELQFVQGIHRPDEGDSIHATEALLQALERLAIFGADPTPRLSFSNPEKADVIAVHPGSGSEKKNWPIGKWNELLDRLSNDHRILVVGGEADRGRIDRLREELPGDRFEFLLNASLDEVGRRLQGCKAFVGHDSGITHLAAAVGLPGLCLWGETNENVWRPRSDRVEILRGGIGLGAISVEDVLDRMAGLVE
jgi:heptosyltransferase-3